MTTSSPQCIAIAGASGFIGSALISSLLKEENISIRALSRTQRESKSKRLQWSVCDLYSMKDTEESLKGCQIAIYLVHSMLPSARLVQGNFQDYDLLLADNFARSAKKMGIKRILYLGGIVPSEKDLSSHLRSRLEVEDALKNSGIPLTALRAGLILGAGGSSFRIMVNLVHRLPLMICPSWTQSLSNPVALKDVISAISYCIATKDTQGKTFDLAGSSTISYLGMMKCLARKLGKRTLFIGIPFVSPNLSRLWVRLLTGAPKSLVYPLVQSLKSNMLAKEDRKLDPPGIAFQSVEEALDEALLAEDPKMIPNAFRYTGQLGNKEARSLQRLRPFERNALELARTYFKWLPRFYSPLIKVKIDRNHVYFRLLGLFKPLLVLEHSLERSSPDRQLFYITGGLLTTGEGRGRLEFRTVFPGVALAAIHEFRTALPWFLYKYSQAIMHVVTMRAFQRHLKKINSAQPKRNQGVMA